MNRTNRRCPQGLSRNAVAEEYSLMPMQPLFCAIKRKARDLRWRDA
jgi:hypothetical protein